MSAPDEQLSGRCALITGAARRIGAELARRLHAAGANVAIHYRHSAEDARDLAETLNRSRAGSAMAFQADLTDSERLGALVESVTGWSGRLDVLVNNASAFYPTPLGEITDEHWAELVGTNLKAPLFLAQAAWPHLRKAGGCIVNLVDIHSRRPLRHYNVYGAAKAGLVLLTRSLAKEMAPEVRVNAIAPGAILWPETGMTEAAKQSVLRQVPLQRTGSPADIADCLLYLLRARYVTGQVIAVDGGRSIGW
ncbi:MAG TPA: pteridine reductase [Woeseiaceae bacterium]|nr:pteridine reductase [Woeseiaceae bacterium]